MTTDGDHDQSIGRTTLRKISWRLLPLLGLGYAIAYVDRINISFAALRSRVPSVRGCETIR
jgi:hypothetical protein